MQLKKNKKGFTLIEIIVVLVIMGILLAIAVPSVLGYVNKAKESRFLSDARAAYLAAQSITVTEKAKGTTVTVLESELNTPKNLNDEIGTDGLVTSSVCKVDGTTTDTGKIDKINTCTFGIEGLNGKLVKIVANGTAEIIPAP